MIAISDLYMLVFAFLIPFVWLSTLRVTVMKTGENSQDALYHAMMAKLGPAVYAAKEFPWTQMSVWKDHFADKELLYHAGLNIIFAIEKAHLYRHWLQREETKFVNRQRLPLYLRI